MRIGTFLARARTSASAMPWRPQVKAMTRIDCFAPSMSSTALVCDSSEPTKRLTTPSPCKSHAAGGGPAVICSN
eukprot:7290276-Alexandrium_andersonii.AAC.1